MPYFQVSLVPASDESKRKLLVVYIHGFMGNETSFQSFPAHLHNLLCVTLDPLGYLVHTKVYPKFKTRYNILVATENFSQWLSKFENENTDVILLGHSMGGLLAADVALLQDYTGKKRHRILGIIAFDTPFLGMHPGVISAGLGSIFRPAPKSPGEDAQGLYANGAEGSSQSNMSLHTMNSGGSQVDEFYSKPPARNYTVVVPKKEGTWDSTLHFINKYQSRLTQATGQYLMSHLEFGGCLADIIGLKNRYSAVRALEDGLIGASGNTERLRFVNYYTSSTGRIKETAERTVSPDSGKGRAFDGEHGVPGVELDHDLIGHERSSHSVDDMKHISADPITDDEFGCEPVALHIVDADEFSVVDGRPPTELSVHENIHGGGEYNEKSGCHDNGGPSPIYPLNDISRQITTDTTDTMETLERQISTDLTLSDFQLPPITPPPEEPPLFDYSQIPDAMVRKVAEKEAARVRKAWEKAVKDYEKAVNNREKELEKLKKSKGKGIDRGIKEKDKRKERQLKDEAKEVERQEPISSPALRPETPKSNCASPALRPETPKSNCASPKPKRKDKKKRDRRFCCLPSDKNDKCWVKVEMRGVDEVGAHCGLFFVGEAYERLVGDVAARMEEWVGEERTRRILESL
ncbi:hypothetical protein DFP73DRAFT_574900 [Morchella snyderi]|nr:hypothetical protein DFP73DRAFT_574900 [Morchella snyderi]